MGNCFVTFIKKYSKLINADKWKLSNNYNNKSKQIMGENANKLF